MSKDREGFWATIPTKALHPIRVPMLEALWWTGVPLSAIGLVDVLDGSLTMWEAAHHLQVLEALGVVKPTAIEGTDGGFEVPFQLKKAAGDDG